MIKAALRKATLSIDDHAGLLRLGLQEQGRPAAARRGARLPALAAGGQADRGPPRRQARRVHRRDRPRAQRRGPVHVAGLQDHGRPVRRQAHVLPRLLRQARGGVEDPQRLDRPPGARRAPARHARQRPRGGRHRLRGRHRRGGGHQADRHRRHPLRPQPAREARDDRLPRAGHQGRGRAQDEGRPAEDVGRPRAPRRGGPDVPGRRPTRRPARPRSPAWASCTSRSSSTA